MRHKEKSRQARMADRLANIAQLKRFQETGGTIKVIEKGKSGVSIDTITIDKRKPPVHLHDTGEADKTRR